MADDKDNKKNKSEEREPKTPPSPPRPTPRLRVTSAGSDGEYKFVVQVTDKNTGVGMKADIVMVDDTNEQKHFTTDEQGYLEVGPTSFLTEQEEFFFAVKGSDESREVTLNGPKQPEPPPKEKIQPVAGGFWANLKNVKEQLEKRKRG